MNQVIPDEWNQCSIGKFLGFSSLFCDGDWVESKDQDPEGSNRLIQLADIGDGTFLDKSRKYLNDRQFRRLNCTELKEGDILIARMPDPLGRACLFPELGQRCATVVDVAILRSPTADKYWLMYVINSHVIRRQIESLSAGTTRTRISRKLFDKILFPTPNVATQKRISDVLKITDRAVAHTESLIEKYQQIKAGLMHDLFTRGIGADGKLRPTHEEAPELYQESAIGWIPREWNVISLSHISDIVRGSTPRPARDPRYFDGNFIPWITVGELSREDWPYLYRTETMLTELGSSFSRVLPKGTLVISNSGYGCGVPKILDITGCANDGVAAFLNLDAACDQLFLYYKLYSQIMILRKKVARGNDQPNLNTDMLGEFRVALPCELEQGKIAEIIWKIDTKIQGERNGLEKLKLKKLGLMQDLLSGKVPVNVDPDEIGHG